MKMTALDLLIDWIEGDIKLIPPSFIEELKKLEKEQIIEAFEAGQEADNLSWYYAGEEQKPAEIYYIRNKLNE